MRFSVRNVVLAAFAVLTGLALAQPAKNAEAAAAASEWYRSDFADVRLISGASRVGETGSLPLGLQFRMTDGWKVYWRSAGDAGFPPEIKWDGSENFKSAQFAWPVPKRFSLFGLETFGYSGEMVYPISVKVEDPSKPLTVQADMTALVCEEICVPIDAKFTLTLPAGDGGPTAFTQLINRFQAKVPAARTGVDLRIHDVTAVGSPKPHSLAVTLKSDSPITGPDAIPEGPAGFSFGKPEIVYSDGGKQAVLTIPAGVPKDKTLVGETFTVTAMDGERFLERSMVAKSGAAGGGVSGSALLSILGLAFLGGLILNLMPCVLPVLSIKLMSVVGYGGAEAAAIRRGFLASALGIVFSFMLLAGAAIAFKLAGHSVGWGVQFQQPVFLVLMAALVMGFAANLWGWFEIPLPRFIADAGAAQGPESKSIAGHFATGMFATLLATPCSAPFLGTAVGFALSRGPGEILSVFAVMGVGLATPYLLVAAVPGLASKMPKPGAWMVTVKRVLSLALVATGIWLLSVLGAQTGLYESVMVGGLIFAAIALVVAMKLGLKDLMAGWSKAAPLIVLAPIVAAVLLVSGAVNTSNAKVDTVASDIVWAAFDQGKIDQLTAAGNTVLVDVTADWCLTCKVNKSLVFDNGKVSDLLASGGITGMQADWTNPDEDISRYLASFGRYGIPFNVVYGPSARSGIPLPELLTESAVLEAVAAASGK